DIAADVLHRVVDRQAGRDHAAGAVDVHLDVAVGVGAGQVEQLADDQVRDGVVDRRAEVDDAVAQQPGEDVHRALDAPVGLDHSGIGNVRHSGVLLAPAGTD